MASETKGVPKEVLEPDAMLHSVIDLHQVIIAEVGLLKASFTGDGDEGKSFGEVEKHIIQSAELVRKARSFYRNPRFIKSIVLRKIEPTRQGQGEGLPQPTDHLPQ